MVLRFRRVEVVSFAMLILLSADCSSGGEKPGGDGGADARDGTRESDTDGAGEVDNGATTDGGDAAGDVGGGVDGQPGEDGGDVRRDGGGDSSKDSGADGATDGVGASCAAICQLDTESERWPVPAVAPDPSTYVLGAGTVTDQVTGLVWQRAVPGVLVSWMEANAYCQGLSIGGQSGWRLPTLIELESLVHYGRSEPAIETTTFLNTPATEHWTSSTLIFNGAVSNMKWTVEFFKGESSTDLNAANVIHLVRCVQCLCTPAADAGTRPPRYTLTAETAFDATTKLTWQRVSRTATSVLYNWANAKTHCESLTVEGTTGWRLPTVKELQSIVDVRAEAPALDVGVFPETQFGARWSANPNIADPSLAWAVDCGNGATYTLVAQGAYAVRCVR